MVSAVNREVLVNQQTFDAPTIPLDVLSHIFAIVCNQSPENYHSVSLVCRDWRLITLSVPFRLALQELIEDHIWGGKDYKKYLVGECASELPIPLGFLLNFEVGKTFLTYAPTSLKFTQANGEIVEEPVQLRNVEKWASNPSQGEGKAVIWGHTMKDHLSEEPAVNRPHWIYLLLNGSSYYQKTAKSLTHFPPADKVSLTDLSLSLLMNRIKTGKEPFRFDDVHIGFSAILTEKSLAVGFAPEGLVVNEYCDEFYPIFTSTQARCSY